MRPTTLLFLTSSLLACSNATESNGVIALEVLSPLNPAVEVSDTLHLTARALDRDGNEVANAPVTWRTPDTTLAVDTQTGIVTGLVGPSTGRVQASTGTLNSNFLTITVRPRPDTLVIVGPDTLRISTGVATSPDLVARIDTYSGIDTLPVSGAAMIYEIIEPIFANPSNRTVELPGGVVVDTVTTGSAGTPTPAVTLDRVGASQPDSAVIEVRATRARGTEAIPGSGQRFIVRIDP